MVGRSEFIDWIAYFQIQDEAKATMVKEARKKGAEVVVSIPFGEV